MSLPAELVGPIILVFAVAFGGWMVYEHRRISAVASAHRQTFEAVLVNADTAIEAEEVIRQRIDDHRHPFWVHDHDPLYALGVHDHPHQHEHLEHVHTLVKLSEHEDTGTKVVVKKCENCGTIFRDRQALEVNGRTQ